MFGVYGWKPRSSKHWHQTQIPGPKGGRLSEQSKSTINSIENWVKQHSCACTVQKSEDEYGINIKIIPKNVRASQILFRIGRHGKFEFGVGKNIYFEDLKCESSIVIDEAVRDGKIKERIKLDKKGRVRKIEGEISLKSGKMIDKRDYTFFGLSNKLKDVDIEYEPYK